MDVKLTIGEEEVGMNTSVKVEVQKDKGGASLKMLDAKTDSLKEEKTALTAEQQDPAKVYADARKLADVIKGANVEDLRSTIKTLASQADSSAIFNFQGLSRGSLLHIAAATGNRSILGLLLNHVDAHLIAAQDDWRNTPLHIATKAKAFGVACMLIRRARDLPNFKEILRIKNKHGNTALHEAVLSRDVGLVSLFMEDLELVYWENVDRKSPLYLALDTGNSEILRVLFSLQLDSSKIQGLPPVHGVVAREQYGLLAKILDWNKKLFAMTDSRGSNVFHLVAFLNKPRVFDLLRPETEYLARERDMNGDLAIHIASKMGHVAIIKKLLPVSLSVNKQEQTVLHVAAKYGRASAVRYMLRHPELGMLINEIDHFGNTALHLAVIHSQPTALIPLLLDERLNPFLLNHKGLTAFEIALDSIRRGPTFRKLLAFTVLESTSAVSRDFILLKPEARDIEFPRFGVHMNLTTEVINSRLLVAALVATVTFTAGFAVPGGFNSTDTASMYDRGMATMLDKRMFQAFTICNTIAMFCSMIAVVNLMMAQQTDLRKAITAFQHTILPLTIALPAMSGAFLTGVTLTVGKLPWLAHTIFFLGFVCLLIISGATLLEYPYFYRGQCRPLRILASWLVLAYIYLWGVETNISNDWEDDGPQELD